MGNTYEDDEIDLLELFGVIMEHWESIAVSTFLLTIISVLVSLFLITPQYASTAKLYVLSTNTSITSLADIQIGNSLTYDYMEVVTGRPVLDKVIKNLELDMEYKVLKEKLSINNPADSRIIEITVKDSDNTMAKDIADEVADVAAAYIAQKMNQDQPSVLQYGYIDEKPVSPQKRKLVMMFTLFGAFISIALVLLDYFLHDTILIPEHIEKKLGLTVLGTLPLEKGMNSQNRSNKHNS